VKEMTMTTREQAARMRIIEAGLVQAIEKCGCTTYAAARAHIEPLTPASDAPVWAILDAKYAMQPCPPQG
jgi:hypothetical protein